ncbi:hypothetical protein [Enterococcus faecalis]|uniref:hypothetical protein n=1 Tax=Enterococcus faecalis TaxID=1351 RepID=UPI002A7496C0|nr:hypothetical protein [Enterococcus faecalis]MDY2554995.1 hypothetical protein [Enterococcus faecalis]
MREEVLNELVPTLQKATDEQLKIIGVGAFGGKLPFVDKEVLSEFKNTLGLSDDTYADRLICKYISNNVESYDYQLENEGATLDLHYKVPKRKKISIEEIVQKARDFREDSI